MTAPALEWLRALGYSAHADAYAPTLFSTLPASIIRRVAGWEDTDLVYLDGVPRDAMDVARATTFATQVHAAGYTGVGVRTAQIELNGRIASNNPSLTVGNGITQDTVGVCAAAGDHATAVAGVIRSVHATVRGMAPAANHWAGGGCDAPGSTTAGFPTIKDRSNAAADWGPRS